MPFAIISMIVAAIAAFNTGDFYNITSWWLNQIVHFFH